MVTLVAYAVGGAQSRDIEDAVGIRARVDALCGEGLDIVEAAVLEGNGVVEGDELVVDVVDGGGVWEVDGEDADALGSWRGGSAGGAREGEGFLCDALIMGDQVVRLGGLDALHCAGDEAATAPGERTWACREGSRCGAWNTECSGESERSSAAQTAKKRRWAEAAESGGGCAGCAVVRR